MGNGSSKLGDAKAERVRDEFFRNRQLRAKERGEPHRSVMRSDPDVEDTQRIRVVLADSKLPSASKGIVAILAAIPVQHRSFALVVLVMFILGMVALGAGKALGWIP